MWPAVEKFSEQVKKYSTWLGQLWYLCVFVFRLIVVVTIGGPVYGDEQSAFRCSTSEPGCSNMCFNAFSKISHIRFWSFQLLAVATPMVLFHFYSTGITGQIEKLKKDEEALRAEEGEMDSMNGRKLENDFKKMSRRKKSVGNVKVKKVYTDGDLKEVPYTNRIHIAYYVSVVFRLALEVLFIYLAYQLFNFTDRDSSEVRHRFDFLWYKVPAMYLCRGHDSEARRACPQALSYDTGGYVPCWVSRPWEKTILIRYMNILSGICFLLSALELIYLTLKGILGKRQRRRLRFFQRNPHNYRHDTVFYADVSNGRRLQNEDFYPSLAVPVQLSNNYVNTSDKRASKKKVRISDEDEVIVGLDRRSTADVRG